MIWRMPVNVLGVVRRVEGTGGNAMHEAPIRRSSNRPALTIAAALSPTAASASPIASSAEDRLPPPTSASASATSTKAPSLSPVSAWARVMQTSAGARMPPSGIFCADATIGDAQFDGADMPLFLYRTEAMRATTVGGCAQSSMPSATYKALGSVGCAVCAKTMSHDLVAA